MIVLPFSIVVCYFLFSEQENWNQWKLEFDKEKKRKKIYSFHGKHHQFMNSEMIIKR